MREIKQTTTAMATRTSPNNKRNSRLSRSVQCANGSKNMLKLNMQRRRSFPNGKTKNLQLSTFCRRRRTWSKLGTWSAKKCTKIYNARAQLSFCSLNFCLVTLSLLARSGALLKLPLLKLSIKKDVPRKLTLP